MAEAIVGTGEYRCKQCGRAIERTVRSNGRLAKIPKYCSTACSSKGRYKPRYTRAFVPAVLSCLACGEEFTQRQKHQQFCSQQCGSKYRRERYVSPAKCLCLNCGKEYHPTHPADGRIFCTRACYDFYFRAYGRDFSLTCLQCGSWFMAKNHAARRCQACCNADVQWKVERTCKECGQLFMPMLPHQQLCSRACARRHTWRPQVCECTECRQPFLRQYWHRTLRCQGCVDANAKRIERASKKLRKARIRAGYRLEGERFTDEDIFERDGWRCQLCGRKVRKDVSTTHPRYATIDHITPVSRGGQHIRVNVQASCLQCNGKKRAKVEGVQLRLIG